MKQTNPITGDMIFDPPLTDEQLAKLIKEDIEKRMLAALANPQPLPFSEPVVFVEVTGKVSF